MQARTVAPPRAAPVAQAASQSATAPAPAPTAAGRGVIGGVFDPSLIVDYEEVERRHVRVLVFGDSGSGKTTQITTVIGHLCEPQELLIVNIDRSITTLRGGFRVYPDPRRKPCVESWEELKAVTAWLATGGTEQLGLKVVAFDTATEAGELLRRYILSRPPAAGVRAAANIMNLQDYGMFADEMLDWIRTLHRIPAHIIVTCQPDDVRVDTPDGRTELIRYPGFGYGTKASAQVNQHFDVVGYLSVVQGKDGRITRTMLLHPVNHRRAKIRTRPGVEAPLVVENPSLGAIIRDYVLWGGDERGGLPHPH